MKKPSILAWVILIFLASVWGSSFILIKKGLQAFSPLQVASIRVTSAAIVMIVIVTFSYKIFSLEKWKELTLSGLLGIFVPAFLFAFAQTHLESAITGTLNALTPLFTLIIGVLFFKQQTTWLKNIGVLIGFIGAVSLILLSSKNNHLDINIYALLVILATVMYGTNINFVKIYLSDIKPLQISVVSVLLLTPWAFSGVLLSDVSTSYQEQEGSFWALMAILTLGIVSTGIATIFFNKLIQISSAIFTSSVTYFIPIIAVIWGVVDGEQLYFMHYLSMGIIIVGVWLVNMRK